MYLSRTIKEKFTGKSIIHFTYIYTYIYMWGKKEIQNWFFKLFVKLELYTKGSILEYSWLFSYVGLLEILHDVKYFIDPTV